MISNSDNPTIVSSTLEGGHSLTLTEAGKLALNFVKHQGSPDEAVVEAVAGEGDGSQVLSFNKDCRNILISEWVNDWSQKLGPT